jgi:hypothetical protein
MVISSKDSLSVTDCRGCNSSSMAARHLATSARVISFSSDSTTEAELMAGKPKQTDTRLSQVGDENEFVGTFYFKLYFTEAIGRGPGPRRCSRGVMAQHSQGRDDAIIYDVPLFI